MQGGGEVCRQSGLRAGATATPAACAGGGGTHATCMPAAADTCTRPRPGPVPCPLTQRAANEGHGQEQADPYLQGPRHDHGVEAGAGQDLLLGRHDRVDQPLPASVAIAGQRQWGAPALGAAPPLCRPRRRRTRACPRAPCAAADGRAQATRMRAGARARCCSRAPQGRPAFGRQAARLDGHGRRHLRGGRART